ncbi:MAG: hypothetical protein PHE32_03065 [Candidatus Shapirobacteria bacterium]|nr:hypothetical protein [Candidatus Shapirobacteria bacterium]MDD4410653.1 hypothetical protein [Candidatus Shapirobacteria bacterium]
MSEQGRIKDYLKIVTEKLEFIQDSERFNSGDPIHDLVAISIEISNIKMTTNIYRVYFLTMGEIQFASFRMNVIGPIKDFFELFCKESIEKTELDPVKAEIMLTYARKKIGIFVHDLKFKKLTSAFDE